MAGTGQTWNTATQSYGTPTNTATQQQTPLNPSYGQSSQGYDYNGISQNPSLATGYYPTEQAAQSAWYASNPGYSQPGTAAPGNATTQSPVAPSAAATGTSSLFQPAYLGQPATVNAATVQAPTAQTAQLGQGLTNSLGSQATIEQLLQGYAPQEQNGQNQLTQMLANFGVGGGQAVGAENQFQGQEAAGIAPAIASAIQNSQGNQLNAGEFNANSQNTGNQFNASNALTAGVDNQNSTNNASAFNAGTINQTNASNAATQNTAQQQQINDLLNQYYAQLGAFNQINTSGQGAQNTNSTNFGQDITVTPDPFQTIFGDVTGAAKAVGA